MTRTSNAPVSSLPLGWCTPAVHEGQPLLCQAQEERRSGGGLLHGVGAGAEHLAQTVLARDAKMQVVWNGGDHQATVQASTADTLDGPEPIGHGPFEEWTGIMHGLAILRLHGASPGRHRVP